MKDTVKDLKERRSIKKYQDRQIEEEDLQEILRAGMNAPTGMGMQSPVMAVIQDKETISKLSKMNAKFLGNESIDPFYGAPTVIVVLELKEIMPASATAFWDTRTERHRRQNPGRNITFTEFEHKTKKTLFDGPFYSRHQKASFLFYYFPIPFKRAVKSSSGIGL